MPAWVLCGFATVLLFVFAGFVSALRSQHAARLTAAMTAASSEDSRCVTSPRVGYSRSAWNGPSLHRRSVEVTPSGSPAAVIL